MRLTHRQWLDTTIISGYFYLEPRFTPKTTGNRGRLVESSFHTTLACQNVSDRLISNPPTPTLHPPHLCFKAVENHETHLLHTITQWTVWVTINMTCLKTCTTLNFPLLSWVMHFRTLKCKEGTAYLGQPLRFDLFPAFISCKRNSIVLDKNIDIFNIFWYMFKNDNRFIIINITILIAIHFTRPVLSF